MDRYCAYGVLVSKRRDITGALNGSRFIEQPHIVPEVELARAFIAGPGQVLIEVGFDHGRRLHSTARSNPGWRVLGLEVRKRRVDEAITRARRDGLENVHPWRMDARTVFAAVLEPESVDVVEILFPTPWWHPGLRMKRLLIDDDFVTDVARALKPHGVLHLATDVESYAESIEVATAGSRLLKIDAETAGLHLPECTQLSRREWKCEREGVPVFRWFFERG